MTRNRIGQVHFSLGDATRLGYDQIKRRWGRAVINLASIALGLSFYASLMLSDTFYSTYEGLGGAQLSVESYQYWLVGVALVVSVVGITNAMLIALYERYKEIGTMKCLGALDRHIIMLFMVESSFQGLAGGVLGFILGLAAAVVSTGFSTGFDIALKVPALRMLTLFVGSVLLALALSMMATMYPAWRASKLKPVEALRYEL
jgi:predicted lysophospholipase L1 biosynthesis ABC-type transport system permease subunit